MSTPFTTITRGSDLQSTRIRPGVGFIIDPDKDGSGTKVYVYQKLANLPYDSLAAKTFTVADGDFVYVHQQVVFLGPPLWWGQTYELLSGPTIPEDTGSDFYYGLFQFSVQDEQATVKEYWYPYPWGTTISVANIRTIENRTILDEIYLAWYERRFESSESIHKNLQKLSNNGLDVIQSWLEANCTSFIDHISGPLNAGNTAFLNFTLGTWRSAAGLNVSGFRRSSDGVSFSYGLMQAGDKIGWWIYEDLQKGLSAMRWTMRYSGSNLSQSRGWADSGENYAEALSNMLTNWPIHSSWGGDVNAPFYGAVKFDYDHGEGDNAIYSRRTRGRPEITLLPGGSLPKSANIYFLPIKPPDDYLKTQWSWVYGWPKVFKDLDEFGFEEDKYWFYQSVPEWTETDKLLDDIFGDTELPALNGLNHEKIEGCLIQGSHWLLKWNFTNSG